MSNYLMNFPVARAAMLTVALVSCTAAPLSVAENDAPKARSDGVVATIADTAITAKVKAALAREDALKASDISVTTTNGVVTLEGGASSSDAKEIAGEKTRMVEGVRSVYNNLGTPSASAAEAKTKNVMDNTRRVVSDSWITTKVKSLIMADSLAKGFEVSVDTRYGVVVLKGELASQAAADHVKRIAAQVEGVKSVDVTQLIVSVK
ncbi:MAG: BON domain-containing protein [Moraxellaceae bacterium]|nr:BON domain-containing protein [Moraxellaceae bacterium]